MGSGASLSAEQKAEVQLYIENGKRAAQKYSKVTFRAAQAGIKEGRRMVRKGLEVARALSRQVDITNSRRNKAIADAKEERRAALLKSKLGPGRTHLQGELEQILEGPIETVIVDQAVDGQPELQVQGIFEEQQVDGEVVRPTIAHVEDIEQANEKRIHESKALRKRMAKRISMDHVAADTVRFASDLPFQKLKSHSVATTALAVTTFKKGLQTRRLEKQVDQFGTDDTTGPKQEDDHAMGWNMKHVRPVSWVAVTVCIVRCPGECQREVDIIYSKVLPALRATVSAAAIDVHLRDMGPDTGDGNRKSVERAFAELSDDNTVRVVLLGASYGQPLQHEFELPAEYEADEDFAAPDLSLLDALATLSAKHSKFVEASSIRGLRIANTLVYTCVDDHAYRMEAQQQAATNDAADSSGGGSPLSSPPRAAPLADLHNPLAILRRKNAEAKRKRQADLTRLSAVVLKALCQDPHTGRARAPHQIFMDLDEDGGGTVDRSEFAAGIQQVGLSLSEEELGLMWESLDTDGSGELSFEEIAEKFQAQYEVALREELREAQFMPAKMALKLERLLPRTSFRGRARPSRDHSETAALREARWAQEFPRTLLDDLERLVSSVAADRLERDELQAGDKAQPLCFFSDIPEYVFHAELARCLAARKFAESPFTFQRDLARQQLLNYANGVSSWPAVLIGGEASGKTTLLADVIAAIRKDRPADHVVFVSVGSSPGGTDVSLVLLQVCAELGKRFGVDMMVNMFQTSTIEQEFPKLLLKLSIEGFVIVVLDGCDLITKDGLPGVHLDWFPSNIPAKVRFVLSADEGLFVDRLRALRSRYSGPTELYEFFLVSSESDMRDVASSSDSDSRSKSRGSSAQSSTLTSSQSITAREAAKHLHLLSSAFLAVIDCGGENSLHEELSIQDSRDETGIFEALLRRLVHYTIQQYGKSVTERCLILLMISRHGILRQDLYELLNAFSGNLDLRFTRISWQDFCLLLLCIDQLIGRFTFGSDVILAVTHKCVCHFLHNFFPSNDHYCEYHKLLSMHYMSKLAFLQSSQEKWHGNNHRALSEVCYHIFKASMWLELKEVLTDLRYIEARCSLGMHQIWSLLLDYSMIFSNKQAKFAWIKTDLLSVKDCYAMVDRYSQIILTNARNMFNIAANLPGATGPARLAKRDWTSKRETRPQLAWINKTEGQSPCEFHISEPRMVMHCSSITRDMTRIVIVGQDRNIYIWKLQDATLLYELEGHEDQIMSCDVSYDDRFILTSSRDGCLAIWNMPLVPIERSHSSAPMEEELEAKRPAIVLSNQLIVSIPAHVNTVWTCAISKTFMNGAMITELESGLENPLVTDRKHRGRFAAQTDDTHGGLYIPVSMYGYTKWTRKVTEDEKRKLRLNSIVHGGYDASNARKSARYQSKSSASNAPVVLDDYVDQNNLGGKIVVYDMQSGENESVFWEVAFDLYKAGAIAVIFVITDQIVPNRLRRGASEMEIKIPIICIGGGSDNLLRAGQAILVQRELAPGNLIASGSSDCKVKVWDLGQAIQGRSPALKPKAVLEHHEAYISHVSFSNNGDKLASSSGDFAVIIWSMKDFSPILLYCECLAPALCSVWAPDDSVIGTTSHDGYVRIWRVGDGSTLKATQGPHKGHLWVCAFAGDQKHFATAGHEGFVVLWDLELMLHENKEVMVFEGHKGPISSLKFSADSKRIVTSSADRSVRVWRTDRDLEDYTLFYAASLIKARKQEQRAKQDLKDILIAASKEIWIYSGAGKVFWEETAHTSSVTCLCFSPNSCELVTAGADFRIIIWSLKPDAPKPHILRTLRGHDASITALCYAPDGSRIASGCVHGNISVWASDTGRRIFEFKEHVERIWSLHFHPACTRMISSSSDMTIRLWRLDDPFAGTVRVPGLTLYSDSEEDIQDEHIKGSLYTENSDNKPTPKSTVNFIDLQESLVLQTIHCPRIIYSCSFAPNRKWMATASADSKICLYEFTDDSMTRLEPLKFIPPLGSNSADMHHSYIRKLVFDHNSRQILSCGVDCTLKLWSTRNGLLLRTFRGHEKEVWSCCISPDSKAVISCSLDGTCRIWNLQSGEELFQVKHHDTVFACDFSPDSRFIATGSYDGVVKLWEKDKMDFQKKQGRGWPRVRDLLPRIARMKENPCAISCNGQICCYVKDDRKSAQQSQVKKSLKQKVSVENLITGNVLYSFVLKDPAVLAAINNDEGETIVFSHGYFLAVYSHGLLTSEDNSGHKASISNMQFSESGISFVSASEDSTILVWKIKNGKLSRLKKLKGHTASILCAGFSRNGELLVTAGQDQCIKIWSASNWKIICTLIQAHTNGITSCAFDTDSSRVVSGGEVKT